MIQWPWEPCSHVNGRAGNGASGVFSFFFLFFIGMKALRMRVFLQLKFKLEQRKEKSKRREDAIPSLCEKEKKRRKRRWHRRSSIPTISPPFFHSGKYYFIHAISVHSSAGASLKLTVLSPPPTFLSMGVTSALPAAGGEGEGGTLECWSRGPKRGGIYNKVALTVVLKTFTQLYIYSARAAAIQTHSFKLNKEPFYFILCFYLIINVGQRLKQVGWERFFFLSKRKEKKKDVIHYS